MTVDHLKLCNSEGIPLEDFKLTFCDHCLQDECTRSQAGTSLFERRIATWEKRLFIDVPRMNKSDPRYAAISAKQFRGIQGTPLRIQGSTRASQWIDPKELDEVAPTPQERVSPPAPELQKAPELPPTPAPKPERKAAPAAIEPPPAPKREPAPARPKVAPILMNTPNMGPQMLKGHENEPPKPAADPWAVAPKTTPEKKDRVVRPGARIKLRRSGV